MRTFLLLIFATVAASANAFEQQQSLICTYSERVEYRSINELAPYHLSDEGIDDQIVVFKVSGNRLELVTSSDFSLIDPWGLQIVILKEHFLVAASENNFLRLMRNYDDKLVGYAGQITDQIITFPLSCLTAQ